MAMGRRQTEAQGAFWVAVQDLPQVASHPFYSQLNKT